MSRRSPPCRANGAVGGRRSSAFLLSINWRLFTRGKEALRGSIRVEGQSLAGNERTGYAPSGGRIGAKVGMTPFELIRDGGGYSMRSTINSEGGDNASAPRLVARAKSTSMKNSRKIIIECKLVGRREAMREEAE